MSRHRDPQLQVGGNYSYLFKLRPNICEYLSSFLFAITAIWSANKTYYRLQKSCLIGLMPRVGIVLRSFYLFLFVQFNRQMTLYGRYINLLSLNQRKWCIHSYKSCIYFIINMYIQHNKMYMNHFKMSKSLHYVYFLYESLENTQVVPVFLVLYFL